MRSEALHWGDVRRTSSFRLTLLLGTLAMAGGVLLLVLIYVLIARDLTRRSDHVLHAEAHRLASFTPAKLPAEIDRSIRENASGFNYLELVGPDGQRIAGNLGLGTVPILGKPFEMPSSSVMPHPLRILALRTSAGNLVILGRDIAPLADLRRQIGRILVLSALLVLPLLLGVGVILSIAPLQRLMGLQRVARTIASGHLDARMPVSGRRDELDLFAATVNQMVEAVELTLGQVKSVTDAIAHDLRTPLTHVRNQLYRMACEDADQRDLRAKIQQAIEELDLVNDRFNALMRISELESSRRSDGFMVFSLAEMVSRVAELYEPLAEEQGVRLTVDAEAVVSIHGNEKLIFEAISNLVDNAIKFTPAQGAASISVRSAAGKVVLEVRDNGVGVPAEFRRAILRRFDRGVASPNSPGSGLGLSIVAAIVHMHRFQLEVASADPGFIARIIAPIPA